MRRLRRRVDDQLNLISMGGKQVEHPGPITNVDVNVAVVGESAGQLIGRPPCGAFITEEHPPHVIVDPDDFSPQGAEVARRGRAYEPARTCDENGLSHDAPVHTRDRGLHSAVPHDRS